MGIYWQKNFKRSSSLKSSKILHKWHWSFTRLHFSWLRYSRKYSEKLMHREKPLIYFSYFLNVISKCWIVELSRVLTHKSTHRKYTIPDRMTTRTTVATTDKITMSKSLPFLSVVESKPRIQMKWKRIINREKYVPKYFVHVYSRKVATRYMTILHVWNSDYYFS